MTRKSLSLAAALALLLAAASGPARAAVPVSVSGTWNVDKVHSEVSFQIRHLVSKVRGRFTDFAGTVTVDAARPEASSVQFTAKVASIDTANADRDKDLRSPKFFDAEKYPEIRFVSTKVVPLSDTKYSVTGNLTMHGVTKEITLPVTFGGALKSPFGDERAGFETEITLNRKDYGINWNAALDAGGFMLGDDVAVTIGIESVKAKPAAPAK